MNAQDELSRLRQQLEAKPAQVVESLQRWMAQNGPEPVALRIAAQAHRKLGQTKAAHQAEIAALDRSQSITLLADATRLLSQREYSSASKLAAEHLQDFPDDLRALTISAESAIGLGYPDRAIPMLEAVVARAPAYLVARTLLANALGLLDRLADARKLLEPILRRLPDQPDFHELLGKLASRQGNFETAIAAYEQVTRLNPTHIEGWTNLADNLRFLGRKQDALSAYRKAIAVNEKHGVPWWGIADLDAGSLSELDLSKLRQLLEGRLDPAHASNMEFALGIAEDKRKNHAAAFAHFSRGNQLRKQLESYERTQISSPLKQHLALFTAPEMSSAQARSDACVTPIFIVGMPRSGSTLVERMLGLHGNIEALGELSIIPHMMERLKRDFGDDELPAAISALTQEECQAMGQWYLARADELRRVTGKSFIIDKMHMNWRHLPLILRILPQAKVIDIRRNAMGCCWSNFRTMFGSGHAAALDQADIGHFYRQYADFVDALAKAAPGAIHQMDYEKLVENAEAEISGLCRYLGLGLEPEMLQFHTSQLPVATASSEQVRQPLNRRGLLAWKPYEQWLGPMKQALGSLATD